jgi:hypothetical protein
MELVGHFNEIIDSLSEKLRSKADGKTAINFFTEINRATLDAIALIAFGMHTESIKDDNSLLSNSLHTVMQTMQEMFFDPFMTVIIKQKSIISYIIG